MRGSATVVLFLVLLTPYVNLHPVPEDKDPETETATAAESKSAPALVVVDDAEESGSEDGEGEKSDKQKRHRPTPSPDELEERRKALIKALGGDRDSEDGGGGGGQFAAGLMGLGALATDVVSLLGSNANETFAPLREARQRARANFPDFGTTLNSVLKNGREYAGRAYRGIAKTARVTLTNVLRFILAAVTRLASTVGGLYQILISLFDVATRGIGVGARFGARALAFGSNYTVNALAKGTGTLRNLASSGILVKPATQALQVGKDLSKGISDDLFDKVEWAQEGINSKLELAQALAPNFLLRAHEKEQASGGGGGGAEPVGEDEGGYSKRTAQERELLSLASSMSELMQRDGRDTSSADDDKTSSTTTEKSAKTTTADPDDGPPQGLLNDIFGLQEEIKDLKKSSDKPTTTESPKKS